MLQVGIRGKRGDRVEDQARFQNPLAVGVERQHLLQAQNDERYRKDDRIEQQHGKRVLFPILLHSDGTPADFNEKSVKSVAETAFLLRITHPPCSQLADVPRDKH